MFSNRGIVLKDGYEIDIRNPGMPDTADRIDSDQTGLSSQPFDAIIDSARIVFPCSGTRLTVNRRRQSLVDVEEG